MARHTSPSPTLSALPPRSLAHHNLPPGALTRGAAAGGRPPRALLLLVAAAVLTPLGLMAAGGWFAWHAAREDARHEIERTADGAAENVLRVLEGQTILADRVNDLLRSLADDQIRAVAPSLHLAMRRMMPSMPSVDTVTVLDAAGRPMVDTVGLLPPARDLSDRDYFRALRDDGASLFISKVHRSRLTGQPMITLARRRQHAGNQGAAPGSFDGAIMLNTRQEVLAQGLARLAGNRQDRVLLVRQDGALLAGEHGVVLPPGGRFRAGGTRGTFAIPAAASGGGLLVAFRPVDDLPLVVEVIRPFDAIGASWWEMVAQQLAIGVPALLLLVLLALVAMQRNRRAAEVLAALREEAARREAAEVLQDSEARLRLAIEGARLGSWEFDLRTGRGTWSARAAEIHGRRPGPLSLVGDRRLSGLPPEERDTLLNLLGRLRGGEASELETEYRFRRPDGSMGWVAASGRVIGYDAAGLPLRAAGIVQDVTARRESEARQALLVQEVDHRAKNALAVVLSFLRLTPRHDATAYATAVEARIGALARVHALLAGHGWEGTTLRAVAEAELVAHAGQRAEDMPRFAVLGPAVQLTPAAAQGLALALHELATNAVRFGAFSVPGGQVTLRWALAAPGPGAELPGLRVEWLEAGGPAVAAPARRGFGMRMIEASARAQLGAVPGFHWEAAGLRCELLLTAGRFETGHGAERLSFERGAATA